MDISTRTQQLSSLFSYDKKADLKDSHLEIIPFRFTQITGASEINKFQKELATTEFCPMTDNHIQENKSFTYSVFTPSGKEKRDKAIILLHGLNERTWEKYLTWAEYLAKNTGKPVILFPIAFHMNRTPIRWCNPRETLSWANVRKSKINDLSNSTFANVALSIRLSKNPLRFYASGRESVYNLWQLVQEIKEGKHPLFKEDTSVNLFAYSIGALLSQVLMLANPEKMFNDTRLFMFCGGSIFSEMDGNARDILSTGLQPDTGDIVKKRQSHADIGSDQGLWQHIQQDSGRDGFSISIFPSDSLPFPKQKLSNAGQPIVSKRIQKSSRFPMIKKENASNTGTSSFFINYIFSMSIIQEQSLYISEPKSS